MVNVIAAKSNFKKQILLTYLLTCQLKYPCRYRSTSSLSHRYRIEIEKV